MRLWRWVSLILAAVLAITCAPLVVAKPVPAVDGRQVVQNGLDTYVSHDLAISSWIRVRDERGEWTGTSGVRDRVTGAPAIADGYFRIASTTKTMVATVVHQLVAERTVDLDAPVSRHLPGLLAAGDKITVRHLLGHTSGLADYSAELPLQGKEFVEHVRFRTYSPGELLAIAKRLGQRFEPGSKWEYSNTNYIVLGLLIEKVTGHSWRSELQHRVLGPAGMRHTVLPGTAITVPEPHNHGYLRYQDGGTERDADITEMSPSWGWAAGEALSTTADVNAFFAALLDGKLLPPAQLRQMLTPVDVPGNDRDHYGLGVEQVATRCGTTVYGHAGNVHGYVSFNGRSADGARQFSLVTTAHRPDPATAPEFHAIKQSIIDAIFCGSP